MEQQPCPSSSASSSSSSSSSATTRPQTQESMFLSQQHTGADLPPFSQTVQNASQFWITQPITQMEGQLTPRIASQHLNTQCSDSRWGEGASCDQPKEHQGIKGPRRCFPLIVPAFSSSVSKFDNGTGNQREKPAHDEDGALEISHAEHVGEEAKMRMQRCSPTPTHKQFRQTKQPSLALDSAPRSPGNSQRTNDPEGMAAEVPTGRTAPPCQSMDARTPRPRAVEEATADLTLNPRKRRRVHYAERRSDENICEDNDTILDSAEASKLVAKRIVANPYAKNKKTPPSPSPLPNGSSQISRSGFSKDAYQNSIQCFPGNNRKNPGRSGATNSKPRAPTPAITRKPLSNPYAKHTKPISKQVRNPYTKTNAAVLEAAHIIPPSTNNQTARPLAATEAAIVAEGADVKEGHHNASSPPTTPKSAITSPQFRRAGISISLPMAERLPSRNVSYRPAEILTVGELYSHLYRTTEDAEPRRPATFISGKLVNVRITGTLLSVATPNNEGRDTHDREKPAGLCSSGTFILLGDPLERTRFAKRNDVVTSKQKVRDGASTASVDVTPSIVSRATPRGTLPSILRNKKMPLLSAPNTVISKTKDATSADSKTPGCKPLQALKSSEDSNVTRLLNPKNQPGPSTPASGTLAKTMLTKQENSSNMNKCGGILSTRKKKRLVYSGGSSGRRSLLGQSRKKCDGALGLMGLKFATPRRSNSMTVPRSSLLSRGVEKDPSSGRPGCPSSLAKRSKCGGSFVTKSEKNTLMESIIMRHPSPIVPVWVGSCFDGDGLDGSVVGDLVMVMGEIVVEHCFSCKMADSHVNNDNRRHDYTNRNDGERNDQTSISYPYKRILCVNDAADSIAAVAMRNSDKTLSLAGDNTKVAHTRNAGISCIQCSRFLKARFVRNANGTDMSLHSESLKARRSYMNERTQSIECLLPSSFPIEKNG